MYFCLGSNLETIKVVNICFHKVGPTPLFLSSVSLIVPVQITYFVFMELAFQVAEAKVGKLNLLNHSSF